MQLSNKSYDVLKKVVQVVLPGLATLYAGLGQLWHFPNVTEAVGTLTLLATFLGLLLGMSSKQYNKSEIASDGDLLVSEVDGEKYLSLGVNKSVEEMVSKNAIRLRVVDNTAPSA